jgi:hypothetical protein
MMRIAMIERRVVTGLLGSVAILLLSSTPCSTAIADGFVPMLAESPVGVPSSGMPSLPPDWDWPPRFISTWGATGTGEGEFDRPGSVAVDSSGNVYVGDVFNYRVQKSDRTGSFIRTWGWGVQDGTATFQNCVSGCQQGLSGSGNGQFLGGVKVAVDSSDVIYATDSSNGRIQRFSSNGNYLNQWGSPGTGAGQLGLPQQIAFDSVGYIYVAEGLNHRVQKFDSSGNFERMWGWGVDTGASAFEVCTSTCQAGISGDGAGQFDYPLGVGIDRVGNVYVSDSNNHRIHVFTTNGDLVEVWGWGVKDGTSEFQICASGCQAGISGLGDGQFDSPSGLAVDAHDDLYVADANNYRVQKLDDAGRMLTKWGQWGTGDGEFDTTPSVALGGAADIYVCDSPNDRIQRFGASLLDHFIASVMVAGQALPSGESDGS